jgi:predicted PurR-regulated permease PerM
MPRTTDLTGEPDRSAQSDKSAQPDGTAESDTGPSDGAALLGWVPKLGVWAWSFVGFVAATVIVVVALGAVSEIVLPLTFAAVLAIVFKPLVGVLVRHRFKPTLAAGLVVLGLLALMAGVVVATVRGVVEQTDEIGASVDAALDKAAEQTDAVGVDQAALDQARAATEEAEPTITGGVLTKVVSGFGTLVAVASAVILGALIMYYLLKDGTRLRRSVVAQVDPRLREEVDDFIGDAIRILRDYGRGRTVMSAIVSVVIGLAALLLGLPLVFTIVVVNFIGGYIPYIGAFLGGGLAVIIALGEGGLRDGCGHAGGGAGRQPGAGELRGAQGHGPHPGHPPAGGAGRHRVGRPAGRDRRPDPGGARHRDRQQRHRPPAIQRHHRAGGRTRRAHRATHPRLTDVDPSITRAHSAIAGQGPTPAAR